jgi:hypothetical protein
VSTNAAEATPEPRRSVARKQVAVTTQPKWTGRRRKAVSATPKPAADHTKRNRAMSAEHKEALAEGRTQGRDVRLYLDALQRNRPKRGRKRTSESIAKRLAQLEEQLATADSVKRLFLFQERIALTAELEQIDASDNLAELQERFISVAKTFSQRKGITHTAWREFGVPADVLRAAGITRSS